MLRTLMENDLINISPCGVAFVKSSVREGILPRMLTEILDTRQMVKQSMKLHKSNSALQRILHSRQLGLKLMANVTYGYTAANFSGRMPCVEVGDSVVSKGRETLERAIKMVESNEKWNVQVVYGDTDSMFVLVPGRSREEAFRIGEEIAEAVTKDNPHPVKLKLEKVYQPCILQVCNCALIFSPGNMARSGLNINKLKSVALTLLKNLLTHAALKLYKIKHFNYILHDYILL